MMSFTTEEYYVNNYLQGRGAVIDTASFPFYATKASRVIEKYTFDNIDKTKPILDEVQMCCCDLAEYLYKEDKEGRDINVQSEKKGEWSASYVSGNTAKEIRQNEIRGIVYNWLAPTGLLYRGC